jgi:hypothetical protein
MGFFKKVISKRSLVVRVDVEAFESSCQRNYYVFLTYFYARLEGSTYKIWNKKSV